MKEENRMMPAHRLCNDGHIKIRVLITENTLKKQFLCVCICKIAAAIANPLDFKEKKREKH